MKELDGAGGWKRRVNRLSWWHRCACLAAAIADSSDSISRCQRERRSQTLATGKYAVPYGLADDARTGWRPGQIVLERFVDAGARTAEKSFEWACGGHNRGQRFGGSAVDRSSPATSDAGAGLTSPRSFRISMRRSASSSRAWQKRESCTPRSVQGEGLLERQIACLELFHYGLELGESSFEVLNRCFGHGNSARCTRIPLVLGASHPKRLRVASIAHFAV